MRTTINGRNLNISDEMRAHVEKKIAKLDKYLRDDAEVQVRFSQESKARNIAEITISLGSAILRAEEVGPDLYACFDKTLDKIVRQIRRHRTKLERRLKVSASEIAADIEPEADDDDARKLVRVKRFAVKPMTVDDAIAQMDMLGHSFFLFLNEETNSTCVVYRRQDGNYGLLQPENL